MFFDINLCAKIGVMELMVKKNGKKVFDQWE